MQKPARELPTAEYTQVKEQALVGHSHNSIVAQERKACDIQQLLSKMTVCNWTLPGPERP